MRRAPPRPARAARRAAGTYVALSSCAMRLIEFIIIYLAAAAPVGVIYFLRQPTDARHAAIFARAFVAGLFFPVTLVGYALRLRRDAHGTHTSDTETHEATHEAKIDTSRKALVAALHNFEDRARDAGGKRAAHTVAAAHALTATVERYTGLTLALAHAEPEGEPDARELELARVAGRTGDDLDIAGRCVRRRNASRLCERQAQSRIELLHALAELQDALDAFNDPRAAHAGVSDRTGGSAHAGDSDHAGVSSRARACAPPSAQTISATLLRVYERAFDLFMLLEDARGVQSLTRLLDATRARLYRHHDADAAHASRRDPAGEVSCKPQSSQAPSTPRPTQQLPTPISARG
jgi:hypothetical protein